MKNIHILPTDKPSRLVKIKDNLFYTTTENIPGGVYQHIYITSDEKAKEGDWGYIPFQGGNVKLVGKYFADDWKKIILTTDQDLIEDGVQAIDDDFLEWFVKNPSCEEVKVKDVFKSSPIGFGNAFDYYKIIIPKEEREQETLEEDDLKIPSKFCIPHKHYISDDDKICYETGYKDGAKWQKERMYSEEDIENIWNEFVKELPPINNGASSDFLLYLKQFKKK